MANVFTHPDCAPAHLVSAGLSLNLTTPLLADGVTLFRSTLYIRMPLDERCNRVVPSPASKLQVRFEPTTVQITSGTTGWVKKWQGLTNQANIELKYPAPISAVQSDLYQSVELRRVDGDAVSEQPTVTVNTGQAIAGGFIAPAFQAKLSGEKPNVLSEILVVTIQESQTFQSLSAAAAKNSAGPFGDAAHETAKSKAMIQSALTRLDLSGRPTTPRLRLLSADQGEGLWQWLEPGEHASAVTFAGLGGDLAGQLQPALDRALALRAPDAGQMVLPLLIESDAPCTVVLQQANLEFLLEADLLSAPAQLSFAGGSEQTQTVSLQPATAQPLRLHLAGSVALHDLQTAAEPPPLASGASRTGIQLEAGTQAAAVWEADRPYWLIGFALAWYALFEHVVLEVALLAEAGGAAAGQPLIQARLETDATGASWLRCNCPQTAVQPGRYWLRVRVEEGSGLWLGEAASPAQAVWQQVPPAAGSQTALPLHLLHFALEPAAAEQAHVAPVQLALNGVALPSTSPRPGALEADADAPAALTAASPWTLAASSASAMSITLQSARLTYLA